MSLLVRILATAAAGVLSSDGVERGSDGTPVAFRMWKAGANPTDMGVHVFTKKSATLLLEEQATRGNLYSFDVDHLSLDPKAPPESRKAVGWFRIATRDTDAGPELWAVDVEWTDAVRAGLTKSPPEWRYFSPAYDAKKASGEIVSLLNCAVTNNPATWSVTALASSTSSKGSKMKVTAALAALCAAMMGDDDDKKNEARAGLKAMAEDPENAEAKKAAAMLAAFGDEPDGDETPEKKEEAAKAAAAKAAEPPPAAPEKKPDDEATKAARAARVKQEGEALTALGDQDRRILKLEGVADREERARILATRTDLTPSQLKVLAKKPTEDLETLLELIPKPPADPAAAARVQATRGSSDGSDTGAVGHHRAARLPPKEREELRQRMGGESPSKGVHWDPDHPNDLVFSTMTRAEARASLAERSKTGRDGAPQRPANAGGGVQ